MDAVDTVDVWALDLHAQIAELPHHLELLDEDEQKRASQFIREADRQRFIIARAALRILVSRRLDVAPKQVAFGSNPFGKPLLATPQTCHFNVSHAGAWIVLALSASAPLGIDVEVLQTVATQLALESHALTPVERAWLAQLPASERGEAFTMLWVCKEAYVKARGEGLSRTFAHICIGDATSRTPSILYDHNSGESHLQYSLARFDLPAHAACLAYLGARPAIRLFSDLRAECIRPVHSLRPFAKYFM